MRRKKQNRTVFIICIITVLIVIFISTFRAASHLGVQQGYTPEQPINFSHKTHTGTYTIACQYCHTGTEKSKHAGYPSVSTCMNCHKGIRKGSLYGDSEIKKIHESYNSNLPISWVKVHNLPDHVYFNHAQHVAVGKLDCNSCHGDVKEMEVIEQKSPLTMSWCMDCHKNQKVEFDNNKYYDDYKVLHDKLKNGIIKQVTVTDIGGLDCQKCHY